LKSNQSEMLKLNVLKGEQ